MKPMVTCFLCSRDVEMDLTCAVLLGFAMVDVCHTCLQRGEEGMDAGGVDEDVA